MKPKKNPKAKPRKIIPLDSFTEEQIANWKKIGKVYVRMQAELFASLAAQRSEFQERLLRALSEAASKSFQFSGWTRIVPYEFADQPLSLKGSLLANPGGRFNYGEIDEMRFPRFGCLYVAENRETANAEYFGLVSKEAGLEPHEYSLRDTRSITYVSVKGELERYIDLTSSDVLQEFVAITKHFKVPKQLQDLAIKLSIKPHFIIQTKKDMLASLLEDNWRALPAMADVPANCQIFGHFVMASGVEGILFPSVRGNGKCLAIFTQNFRGTSSFVELLPPHPEFVHAPRVDGNSPH